MDERFYNLSIKFDEPWKICLDIAIGYEYPTTKEEVERNLDFYQWHFSKKLGKNVPREEVKVRPLEGELIRVTTHFRVRPEEPLHPGLLQILHRNAPYVLPRAADDLNKYILEHKLNENEIALVKKAANSLKEIIESEEKH